MAIPDYQTIMLPMLKLLADGRTWSIRDLTHALSDHFGLTPEEREQRLPSGQQQVIVNRSGWSRMYLKFAGLLADLSRGNIEGKTVVLVDGARLAELMIEHGLGVTTTKMYALKEVSNDFFDEGEG